MAFRPLISPLNHYQVVLEGLESPKSLPKLVLPENVSKSSFYSVIPSEMGPKVAILIDCFKAIGGRGVKNMLSLYERAFQYEVSAFYRMSKFNS